MAQVSKAMPELPDAELVLIEGALEVREADQAMVALLDEIAWQQREITLFGRRVLQPRMLAWHGDPGAVYRYSGSDYDPEPWTPTLLKLRKRCEELAGQHFNSVLVNRYRDGRDSMGWHSDNEPELGEQPVIASLSLGAERDFQLKHKEPQRFSQTVNLPLPHGSLLIMRGATQAHWKHALPKRACCKSERINLTFRQILRSEG